MLMKVYPGILVLFALYLTLWVDQNYAYYSNDAGYCSNSTSSVYCYISNNNTQAIKSLLSIGTQGTAYRLHVYKRYGHDKGSLTLDIEIPSNIRSMNLYLSYSYNHEQIILRTSSKNTNLQYMYCNLLVKLESQNFFNQFVGLTQIYFSDVVSNNLPSFSQLDNLRYLTAKIKTGGNQVLDSSFVSGLKYLQTLNLRYSSFTSIAEGAFDNMDNLYYLYLDHNRISSIEDNALRGRTYLRYLSLEDNGLGDVSYNAFRDLTNLDTLILNENPDFPLQALISLKNIRYLYLNFNNYKTIDPYVFQQMDRLSYLYMNNPFTCDCNLEWASAVQQYSLYIRNSYCLDPIDVFGRSIGNKDSYTNCTQTQSYQCFDKSVTCENNEVCHNTENSYYCGCPIGYEFNNIGHCSDVNECDKTNHCQHSCENTEGTFHCACNEGYKLSNNGYDCEDINECQEWNGDCEYGCKNTIGSYQCYCEAGHQLYNRTTCNNDFQCELVGNSYNPLNCTEGSENFMNCNSGLNFSVTNLPCVSAVVQTATCKPTESTKLPTVPTSKPAITSTKPAITSTKPAITSTKLAITSTSEPSTSTQQATVASFLGLSEWTNPILILLIIPLIIVGMQTIIIVILIVCVLKRTKRSKNNLTTPALALQNLHNLPINHSSESQHGMSHYSHEKENPERLSPTLQVKGIHSTNMAYAEPYPGEGSIYMTSS